MPACILLPQIEEVAHEYGQNKCTMPVIIQAMAVVGDTNPSVVQEALLGDAIKIMTDSQPYIQLSFAAGGYTDVLAGDVGRIVTGGVTGDTGRLISYSNITRKWIIAPVNSGDEFDDDDEAVTITGGTGAGTLSSAGEDIVVTSLVDDIRYVSGGPREIPKSEDTAVAVIAEFNIVYTTLTGNPYSQE